MFGQNAPPFYSVLGSSGSSPAPPINYIGATPQLNFATILNTGGFLGNSPATGTVLADGVSYDGSAWTAKDTGAVALQMNGALPGIVLYANSGLTPGVAYGPTAAVTWLGPGNPWTFTDKIDVASLPAADATNAGILTGPGTVQQIGGNKEWTNQVATQGTLVKWSPAAYLALTASTENPDVNYNLARTVQFATGALALQRAIRVQSPTYGFVGASTVADAVTFAVDGAPAPGTNATFTKSWAATFGAPVATGLPAATGNAVGIFGAGISQLVIRNTANNVEAFVLAGTSTVQLGSFTNSNVGFYTFGNLVGSFSAASGKWTQTPQATSSGVLADWAMTPGVSTGITASTESNVWRVATQTRTWAATGTVATQRDYLFSAMTLASASASQTFTDAATVAISGAPIAGSNAIITRSWALYVQGGDVCLAGSGSALATNTTAGFTWLPSMAGTPTGAPSQKTGTAAIVIDTTGSKIWVLIGGTWKSVAVA